MNSALQEALREAYATAQSNVVQLDTLEFSHPNVDPLFLVKDRVDHLLRLETGVWKTFIATAIRFTLPATGENGLQDLNIAVDNVDRRPTLFVQKCIGSRDPVQVVYRPYLSTDNTAPQIDPPLRLYLRDIQIRAEEVTGRATFADVLNRKFLTDTFNRRRFPTL